MTEIYPHQPEDNNLLRLMGELLLELQRRAARMGISEYIDVLPADPARPEEGYHWDYYPTKPKELFK